MARKGKGRGGFGGRPAASRLEELGKLQAKMAEAQEALAQAQVVATAGGGGVTVTMNGQLSLQSVEIAPEAVDPQDLGMLEDLILVAVNEAIAKAQALAAERMSQVTGSLGLELPGGLF